MKIVPLYRYENVFLIGLESDFQDENNLDGLVAVISLRKKKIEYPAWSIQKMLKFGYYYWIDVSERQSLYDLIINELGEDLVNQIEEKLLFPSQEAIDSLIWIPKRLEKIKDKQHTMSINRQWQTIREYEDIFFDYFDGIGKITINRERYRNAFRPTTVNEISDALKICREDQSINVVVLTGAGDKAFCAGGDQTVKGKGGYIDKEGIPRLNILEVQKQIRSMPKPVIAMVNGFAIGGGHVLHVVCDITIASENAIFGQTGPKVGSFDAGLGSSYLASIVGQKKAREIWFMCRQYSAAEALEMGLVNKVVPFDQLEDEVVAWGQKMQEHSPLALRMLKLGLNAELDGQIGIQEFAGNATLLYYLTEEAQEGKNAFLEKRKPDFKKYPKFP